MPAEDQTHGRWPEREQRVAACLMLKNEYNNSIKNNCPNLLSPEIWATTRRSILTPNISLSPYADRAEGSLSTCFLQLDSNISVQRKINTTHLYATAQVPVEQKET